MNDSLSGALRALDRASRLATSHDATVYGIARSSPTRFYTHHLAAHSSAIVFADAVTVHMSAAEQLFRLSVGMP